MNICLYILFVCLIEDNAVVSCHGAEVCLDTCPSHDHDKPEANLQSSKQVHIIISFFFFAITSISQ